MEVIPIIGNTATVGKVYGLKDGSLVIDTIQPELGEIESVTVEITLNVYDKADFRMAAYNRAKMDGLSEDEAKRYLDIKETSLAECAQMIIDPGISPDGADIVQSSAE